MAFRTPALNLPYSLVDNRIGDVLTEMTRELDVLIQPSILDRDLSTPPASPAQGASYIVKATGLVAWAGKDNKIATWWGSSWTFYAPVEGWTTWLQDENIFVYWDGAAWSTLGLSTEDVQDVIGAFLGADNGDIDWTYNDGLNSISAAIKPLAVVTGYISNLAVTTGKIANLAVDDTKLAADAVITVKILNDNVTYPKIQNVSATDKVLGRSTAGAGDIEEIACTASGRAMIAAATAAAQTALLSGMVGDSGSGGTKGLVPAPGTGDAAAGKFLKADATFAVPPGAWTLLATLTTTSGTTQSATGLGTTKTCYMIILTGVSFTASGPTLTVALSTNNGSSYGAGLAIAGSIGTASNGIYGICFIPACNDSNGKSVGGTAGIGSAASFNTGSIGAEGGRDAAATAAVNALQFAGGTFDAGAIYIYGC